MHEDRQAEVLCKVCNNGRNCLCSEHHVPQSVMAKEILSRRLEQDKRSTATMNISLLCMLWRTTNIELLFIEAQDCRVFDPACYANTVGDWSAC